MFIEPGGGQAWCCGTKTMHNVIKYVKYAEYGTTLSIWVCDSVLLLKYAKYYQFCTIFSVCVCGSMEQCPAASGCPSSDCVAAIDPGSRPVDSSSIDKVVARCKTKNKLNNSFYQCIYTRCHCKEYIIQSNLIVFDQGL